LLWNASRFTLEYADKCVEEYNKERTHSGKYCFGKTLYQTFLDSKNLANAKIIGKLQPIDNTVREVSSVRWCLGYYRF
jgi:hypothetical protein